MGHQPIKFISLTMSGYDAGKGGAMLAHQLPCMETRKSCANSFLWTKQNRTLGNHHQNLNLKGPEKMEKQ